MLYHLCWGQGNLDLVSYVIVAFFLHSENDVFKTYPVGQFKKCPK